MQAVRDASVWQLLVVPGFGRVGGEAVLIAGAEWMERLAIGWLIFDRTDSALLTTAPSTMPASRRAWCSVR